MLLISRQRSLYRYHKTKFGPTVPSVCILLCCSFMMEYDIHTVLDFLTLVATVWVIYTLRIPLKDTYQEEQDSVQTYYVVGYLILGQSRENVSCVPYPVRMYPDSACACRG